MTRPTDLGWKIFAVGFSVALLTVTGGVGYALGGVPGGALGLGVGVAVLGARWLALRVMT